MSNQVTGASDARRSSRITLSLPIVLHGKDSQQQAFRENTHTLILNRHGAKLLTSHQLVVGAEVLVENPTLGSVAKANVVWIGTKRDSSGLLEAGVQLVESQNIWGIEFPPDDWTANATNKPAATAKEAPAPTVRVEKTLTRAATPSLTSEQIATQILQDLHETADAHARQFTERLDQVVQRIGLEVEIDLRARATAAKEAELAAIDHQIMASSERLSGLKSVMEDVEIRIEEARQALGETLARVPPPLTPEQIQEKVEEEALPVLHLITEGGIAAARERFQTQVQADTSQALIAWRDNLTAERETLLEEARQQITASVNSALETLGAQRGAGLQEMNRRVQEEIQANKERVVSQLKSKLDVAAEGQSAALVERLLETMHETGERQANLLQTQLDALLVSRLEQAQRHARSAGDTLQNSVEEGLRAAGEKVARELQGRLQEIADHTVASSSGQVQKQLEASAIAAGEKNLQDWQTRLQAMTDQAVSSSSEKIHAQVVDSVTVIANEFLQQSEARLHEFAEKTIASSSDHILARIEKSAHTAAEKNLQDWQTRLAEIASQAVASSTDQIRAQIEDAVKAIGEKNLQQSEARLQEITEKVIALGSDQIQARVEESVNAAAEKNLQGWQTWLQEISDKAVSSSSEQIHAQVEDAVKVIAEKHLQQSQARLQEIAQKAIALASGQIRAQVEASAHVATEKALQTCGPRVQDVADRAVEASAERMRGHIEEMARSAVEKGLQAWQTQLQAAADRTAASSAEQIRARVEKSAQAISEQALQAWQAKLQKLADHAAASSSDQVQAQIKEALGLMSQKLQEMRERAVNDAVDAFRGRLSQFLGLLPSGGSK